ncbi:3-dehydroquinate synthase [Rasiella rasia]|uniref:3-dehydroquinate synthase n=1 Tax=Rasiella rasia TaxID=2744027 RepID=A0A6G6GID4_9FLAO|nr:3-dehydroquinate synthase [Rasiella rasia]QIE58335.1 3-dehydroquinate synthase [Rasiella rasia]
MEKIEKARGSVYCGIDVWKLLNEHISALSPSKIIILTDSNTQKHCLPILLKHINTPIAISSISIPAGEEHKTIATCNYVWEELSNKGADRKSVLINLGGGVVTDLGGFVACTYKRGIEFINIPTSLLAMVDASVGGKNGVDLGHVKNQIGIIKNPYSVYVSVAFLETLPSAHLISGYAEMLKHGLIASETYWQAIKAIDFQNAKTTEEFIWTSIEIKNKVVTEDPTELGIRKTLNYGHTLGHAIESYCLDKSDKQTLLHGEAVAIGLILANYISFHLVNFPKKKLETTTSTILSYFPKQSFSEKDIENIIELLKYDKKNVDGNVNFVLLRDFNNYVIDQKVSNDLIYSAFEYYKNFKN